QPDPQNPDTYCCEINRYIRQWDPNPPPTGGFGPFVCCSFSQLSSFAGQPVCCPDGYQPAPGIVADVPCVRTNPSP
ncbi:MAG: hypothetical protein QXF48_02650, partial [Candidatus Anstonellaceae archaeon]